MNCLKDLFPDSKYILFEASKDVAELTKHNCQFATVIPSAIDEIELNNNLVDLAIVCGVDYLFPHFRNAIIKIWNSLTSNGYIYIERNVFVETEAYYNFPIRTYSDLFGQNALMTTWFAYEQYKLFLSMFFDIIAENSFTLSQTDGYKCIIRGFLCKKKLSSENLLFYTGNNTWYQKNIESLMRLEKNSSARSFFKKTSTLYRVIRQVSRDRKSVV